MASRSPTMSFITSCHPLQTKPCSTFSVLLLAFAPQVCDQDMMEEDDCAPMEARLYYFNRMMYPSLAEEIVELDDNKSKSFNVPSNLDSIDRGASDVYVAVGKDDLHVVKWALDHAVSPGARLFLIHVFPPITFVPTPVGKLAISQLSQEQVQKYEMEENNRRKKLMGKYIELCNDAKVPVETMLNESNATPKAILDLVYVLNITQLVIGTKNSPSSRRRRIKKMKKGGFVMKNAPDFCEVTIVQDGKNVTEAFHACSESPRQTPKKSSICGCFP